MVRRWRIEHTTLLLIAAANFTQLGTRLAISPVVPRILDEFRITKAAIGLALTGMWATYALFQFPGGVLGERYGQRPVVVAALSFAAIGSVLLAASPAFAFFSVFAVLLGAGTGLFFPAGASLLTGRFENTGGALSVLTAGGAVAGLVTPLAAAGVAARFGWRGAVLLGLAAVPVAAAVARFVPPTTGDREVSLRDRFDPGRLLALIGRPTVLYTVVIAAVGVFVFQAITSFFPTFLVEYRGVAEERAALAFGLVFLISAVAQPVAGRLSDRVGRDATLACSMSLAAAGIGLLVGGGRASAIVGVCLLGAGVSWPGVVQARFMDALSAAERDVGFGLVRTAYMFLGAFGSTVTGVAVDLWGWPAAFAIVAGLLAVGVGSMAANRALGLGL